MVNIVPLNKENKSVMNNKKLSITQNSLVPVERIENKILLIKGEKVMLDRDLAELYGVKTKILK